MSAGTNPIAARWPLRRVPPHLERAYVEGG